MILRYFCAVIGVTSALQALPPVLYPSNNGTTVGFSLTTAPKAIYINSSFANHTDTEGLTLIPPTAYQFAEIFRQDISQLLNTNYSLLQVDTFPPTGIFLGQYKGNASDLTYEDGTATEEGYELQVGNGFVYVGGSGARGMFWGTRTLLQEMLIANGTGLQAGRVADAPAYATRGYMLDAGRKWYAPDFLKDLCTYASFFKMSEFHYHSSDNYPLNRGHNETWQDVFSHFSLYPENKDLQGIVQRQNETLSRQQFEDFQTHCAQRGITVVPEIEAPGHCLSITKWKPELALDKKDLLNLSHPDAIPTVKAIWSEFLPWFQTKEVHIGADEYDATLADDYINFVNEMADFVNSTSGKQIRIWGTNEPSKKSTISKDIIIQHWQYGESDPVQVQKDNYSLINSEDWWAYMSLKNDHTPIVPAPYPQFFNNTRALNFANVPDWQWEPSLFNYVNTTEQLEPGASGNKGAILAAWNDNGPDATTQLEAYYAMREGIPVVAARAWAGHRGINVSTDGLQPTLDFLTTKAPGQNLDRDFPGSQCTLKATSGTLYGWNRTGPGVPNVTMGKGSYGPPYTLIINATAEFTLTGPDTFLSIETVPSNISSNGTTTLVFSTTDGFPYPLRSTAESDGQDSGAPGRIWTNVTTSTHHPVPINFPATIRIETDVVNGSRVWIDNNFKGRFEVFVFGGKNTLFSWSQMALVAPLDTVGGGVTNLTLNAGIGGNYSAGNGPDGKPTPPSEHKPNAASGIIHNLPAAICGLVVAVLLTMI